VFDINDSDAETAGFKIRGLDEEELVLTYNLTDKKLTLDCTKMGKAKDGVRNLKTCRFGIRIVYIKHDSDFKQVFGCLCQVTP
jgi:beta-fructofuranosidase